MTKRAVLAIIGGICIGLVFNLVYKGLHIASNLWAELLVIVVIAIAAWTTDKWEHRRVQKTTTDRRNNGDS